eukprot:TRINITY_DN7829_c0_g1_i2.p1 TRINITY_DN7829_c0_g1~~TRINITY_DN7829_c0_g1_i2.p1  ORF type:complete len:274 (-),score=47.89 TRINITY_DN7829_c0_g1_i2:29-778(-)
MPAPVLYEVERGLFVGDARTATTQQLATHVLDVSSSSVALGIARGPLRRRVTCAPMPANGEAADLFTILPECFSVISSLLPLNTVCVCCETGGNQSAVVVLAYLVVCRGMPLAEAIILLKLQYHAAVTRTTQSLPTIDFPLQRQTPRISVRRRPATSFVRHSSQGGEPAPEPCYCSKLMEVEAAFCAGATSFRLVTEIITAFYGREAVVSHVDKWQEQLLRQHHCHTPFLQQYARASEQWCEEEEEASS